MGNVPFPVIDLVATGKNIRKLRQERGLTVRDIQDYFGFEEPRAIYKWQKGESLPSVDNLYALGNLLGVPMDQILVPVSTTAQLHSTNKEQQGEPCCSNLFYTLIFLTGSSGCSKRKVIRQPFLPFALPAAYCPEAESSACGEDTALRPLTQAA